MDGITISCSAVLKLAKECTARLWAKRFREDVRVE
jgi:hypothetical protein